MKETAIETELYCMTCLGQAPHTVIYVNDILYKVTCEQCGKESVMEPDLIKEIYTQYVDRIISKPHRITQEFREDLSHFISTLPYRVISKPYRTYQEFSGIFHYRKKASGWNSTRSIQSNKEDE
ncbi:hypothetical protein [Brevibacillus daliensis]|uniref:hypothetical protein n=1 Tax=Brevibacillus daliensis TaxID=2892995 RepID=UPI001E51651C|nr:hypothetical protein [Brevibacillus daliensis]